MVKVEAVVIRERVETVIDAVEEETGHVGVTVVEAVGHGRQRGITHEYRGRVFESRFLPKALLVFVVHDDRAQALAAAIGDAARSGNESGDGIVWTTAVSDATSQPHGRTTRGGGQVHDGARTFCFATSTVWVVIAAVLVMFMQAGFAFLEAGLTRMKNVGHVAAKNVLIFAHRIVVYYLVGLGLAFGDGGNGLVGGSGFAPDVEELLTIGAGAVLWFGVIPAAAGYLFEVVFCGVSLAIVWGAMAERTKLFVYLVFGVVFTVVYSVVSHWVWSPNGWLFSAGMQDFAGSTVVHYQGALAGARGSDSARAADREVRRTRQAERDPGHNMAYIDAGRARSSGSGGSASIRARRSASTSAALGFFAYVALNTNIAAAAGVLGRLSPCMGRVKKPICR